MKIVFSIVFLMLVASCCDNENDPCPCTKDSQVPMYRGGSIYDQIYAHIKYPEEARLDSVQGRVTISFDVYTDGDIGNFAVVTDTLGHGLSDAAIKAAMTLSEVGFCPARQNCNPIDYNFILPVLFVLHP